MHISKVLICLSLPLILVSCGGGGGGSSNDPVKPMNTAPVFVGVTDYAVDEGVSEITTIKASDAQGDSVTFSINGDDAGQMNINSSTGLLSFNSPPDYENPLDANSDNVYIINIVASDGSLSSSIGISITVNDVMETSQLQIELEANKYEISAYSQVSVSWTSANAESCTMKVGDDDFLSISKTGSKLFYFSTPGIKPILITCQNSELSKDSQIDINVTNINLKDLPDKISLFKEG
jgi:hypothetical protein